jgi:hypothetical protein
MNKMKIKLHYIFLLTCLSLSSACIAQQTTIRVRLVDGRTGKPVVSKLLSIDAGIGLEYYGITQQTGSDGVFNASFKEPKTLFRVGDEANHRCDGMKQSDLYPSYTVQDIADHGIVSPNVCGKIHAQPMKGEIVIYVRPFKFGESFRRVVSGLLICG